MTGDAWAGRACLKADNWHQLAVQASLTLELIRILKPYRELAHASLRLGRDPSLRWISTGSRRNWVC